MQGIAVSAYQVGVEPRALMALKALLASASQAACGATGLRAVACSTTDLGSTSAVAPNSK